MLALSQEEKSDTWKRRIIAETEAIVNSTNWFQYLNTSSTSIQPTNELLFHPTLALHLIGAFISNLSLITHDSGPIKEVGPTMNVWHAFDLDGNSELYF